MILNSSKIKTEALLLFCKDLILSYKDKSEEIFTVDKDINTYTNNISEDILKQINNVTFDTSYYINNRKHFRIKAVLNAYNFLNKEISNSLKKGMPFNPSMLLVALLAVWFKELDKERTSKEFIYFTLFTYASAYDKLLINIKDEKFKVINIAMLELAENIIYKYDKISLK